MKASEKVLKLFPDAYLDRMNFGGKGIFRVTIKPGRYAYGRMKSWAWKSALDSIQQEEAHPPGRRTQP